MTSGPPKKTKTVPVGFRCPVELRDWVEGLATEGDSSKTGGYLWTLERGRDFVEAAGAEFAKRLDGYAAIFGQERTVVLRRILEKGLAEIERELRNTRGK